MEPRTSAPEKRLEAIAQLVAAGIPTSVSVAPVIPGLNDHEMPAILAEVAARGALSAGYAPLRLPYAVKDLFIHWLRQHFPERADKVINAIRDIRRGRLNDPCFGSRFHGEGERAETIARMFDVTCRRYGLHRVSVKLATKYFRRSEQTELFEIQRRCY